MSLGTGSEKKPLFLERGDAENVRDLLNDLIDDVIFSRTDHLNNNPRANFLLVPAFKPIVIGVCIGTIITNFALGALTLLSSLHQRWPGTEIVGLIGGLILVFAITTYIAGLLRTSLDNPISSKQVARWNARNTHFGILVFFALSVPGFLNILEDHASNFTIPVFASVSGFLGAGFVNFFRLRKNWVERYNVCFSELMEIKRLPLDSEGRQLRAMILAECLISFRMWAHPMFSTFFRDQLDIKRDLQRISRREARALIKGKLESTQARSSPLAKAEDIISELRANISINRATVGNDQLDMIRRGLEADLEKVHRLVSLCKKSKAA